MPEGNNLATLAINAHGGLDRWRQLKTVSARLLQGGVLWQLKRQDGVLDDVHVTVDLRKEWASHRPFGQPDRHSSFQPNRVAIETSNGDVVEERVQSTRVFRGTRSDTPWDSLQLAYFAGYAMWTYLNTPFLFALPGVKTEEVEAWPENGEVWRRLKVTFPTASRRIVLSRRSTSTSKVFSSGMTTRSTFPEEPLRRTTCRNSKKSPESSCQPNT